MLAQRAASEGSRWTRAVGHQRDPSPLEQKGIQAVLRSPPGALATSGLADPRLRATLLTRPPNSTPRRAMSPGELILIPRFPQKEWADCSSLRAFIQFIFKGSLVDPRMRASNEHILIVRVPRAGGRLGCPSHLSEPTRCASPGDIRLHPLLLLVFPPTASLYSKP